MQGWEPLPNGRCGQNLALFGPAYQSTTYSNRVEHPLPSWNCDASLAVDGGTSGYGDDNRMQCTAECTALGSECPPGNPHCAENPYWCV